MNKKQLIYIGLIVIGLYAQACSDDGNQNPGNGDNSEWLLPTNLIFDGGPGKDGIPSVDKPRYTKASEVDFLNGSDLIDVYVSDSEVVAYPHDILDWHEIVNDKIDEKAVAISYCPLTGTGIAWNRTINGKETTFGVSGLLYNTNLMPFDRQSNST